ncbi:MAG: sigma 54-interacting transcriptional regulator [Clostridiales Family XIII bacterium]|jgi:PAS domain S-box-containing protein|nr:sigma 54-interacting transcriptional regulator [Clostridiales Family XIII bacterium]
MNKYPITLNEKDPFGKAVDVFASHKTNGIPIVNDKGAMTGIISLARAFRLLCDDVDRSVPLENVMIKDPIVIEPEEDIDELIGRPVSALPVVKGERLVGLYSMPDTIRAYYNSTKALRLELDTIIKGLYNGIVTIDASETVRVINPAAAAALGVDVDAVIGKNINDVFPQAGMSEVMKSGRAAINRKIRYGDKTFLVTCTKVEGDREIGIAIINDFTELAVVYEELSQTKEVMQELETIIETSSDGILVADEKGGITKVNTALAEIFAEKTEAIIGKNITDYRNVFGEDILNRLHAGPQESGDAGSAKSLPLCAKIGKTRLMVVVNPIVANDGAHSGFVADIQDITRVHELERQVNRLEILYRQEIKKSAVTEKYIFNDPVSRCLLEKVLHVAKVDSTVLITGESGVGKEVVAEILFNSGSRADKPFVKINCGAIPETLLESELFGYEPGAFTGAGKKGKLGILEIANNGTIFLDEIGALPISLQVKLLRVLQSQEIMRVGGIAPKKIDVRVIAATNKDLAEMVRMGNFRADLYYRLNVVPIFVMPLRERKEDIPALLHHFLGKYNAKYKLNKSFGASVIKQMLQYGWPGNVRELENMVERSVVTSNGDTVEELPDETLHGGRALWLKPDDVRFNQNYKDIVNGYETVLLRKALEQYGTTRKMSAALGLNQSTIVKKMSRLGIARW